MYFVYLHKSTGPDKVVIILIDLVKRITRHHSAYPSNNVQGYVVQGYFILASNLTHISVNKKVGICKESPPIYYN